MQAGPSWSMGGLVAPTVATAVMPGMSMPSSTTVASGGNGMTPVNMSTADYFKAVSGVSDKNFALYYAILPPLNQLLTTRIDGLILRRNLFVLITLIALALTVYLLIGFYLAVENTIPSLALASMLRITGNPHEGFTLENRDERPK